MRIRETRKLVVHDVVIGPDDVRALAQLVRDAIADQDDNHRLHFTLRAFDSSEYDGATLELLEEGGLLDTRQVREIRMYTTNRATDSEIHVLLCHETGKFLRSEITVVGYDSTWVNGVIARLQHVVDECESQALWPRRLRWVLIALGALVIGTLYQWIINFSLDRLVHVQPLASRPPWAEALRPFAWLIQLTLDIAVGWAPSFYLVNRFTQLWPRVELRTGKEYAQVISRRRRYAWVVFSLIVLPVLLSALYDGLKYLHAH
jgi:hypothetical protein